MAENGDPDALEEEEPQVDTSFSHAIIVDGLPKVPPEKHEKLNNVIRKFFSQVGKILENGLDHPKDPETGMSLGFAFIEFSSADEANAAVAKANGYRLDKSHMFVVNLFTDFAKYASIPDEEVEAQPEPYVPKENLKSWLLDPTARDQFVVRYNEECEIWWNDPTRPDPVPEHSRRGWSENYVAWSPRGTYLATFHNQGIMLWAGASWKRMQRLSVRGVKLLDFSPCERFVVTWTPEGDQKEALVVWSTATGAKLRAFQGTKDGDSTEMAWPAFRWSHDDEFFARLGEDCIYVYESCSMKLIKDKQDKRSSVKADGVRHFLWSPTDNVVSLWAPEHMNQPAKVVLMELPSRSELRQKNLFSVADLRMTWHEQGHFLCVKVDKHSKSKKTLNSAFELFRLRDKGVPIEVQEFSKDTTILAFAWEPKGLRFAVVHADGGSNRTDVSIHTMGSKHNGRVSLLKTCEKKVCNGLFWSPAGGILLLANLKGTAGQLEWLDVNVMQTIGEAEHFMCSDIEWDPTGRFVATSVSHWRHQMENGYNLWTSHGRQCGHVKQDKFYQLLWRPRPPSLLTETKEKEVRRNLRDYSKKYEEDDLKAKRSLQGDMLKQRKEKHEAFEAFLSETRALYAQQRAARVELRGGLESDNESAYTLIEDVDEVELSYKEEIIGRVSVEIGDD
eukprot:CAMPEP_0183351492 /NCGR_PEP_ID=MMETSP0164_2-20130417/25201_1 /TAXON_ID=221442 /ORGANISM="Coccolithus pelagicus ssp braarudi, Strain PLY182g" /LENGTH=673 /DNA_ID=CAMNT_0025523685 /DNA_START=48 /DNA_END=2069 /DNA_ORIENTATION=+